MSKDSLFDSIKRAAVSIYSEDTLRSRLRSGKPLKIKLGADPSRPDLHLGHSVVLRRLRKLQDAGHTVIFVIGDFTAMIGDPSGKNKTRPPLSFEETRQNGETYFAQVTRILDPARTVITYNSAWLAPMTFAEVLGLAGRYTLARVMERDDFAKRYAENHPIGLHELYYPLMQGYDSVELDADIEVGGTDQTFNLLVGRELMRDYGKTPQEVITFPLLAGLDGVMKMSKSLDNYIAIDEPPETQFEKCMRVPDVLLADYIRLTTDIRDCPGDIREAHFTYAREIVRLYHGEAAIAPAESRYREISGGGIPAHMDERTLTADSIGVLDMLTAIGLAASNGDARRLIAGGGIRIDGECIRDAGLRLAPGVYAVSRGKGRYMRVILAPDA